MDHYLPRILRARVYDVARETPLEQAINLSRRLHNSVWLKREDLQPVFSFKLRGAYNKMAVLSDVQKSRGVIAASAGNHAQGVALAARELGMKAVIVMGRNTPSIKIDAVRDLGAKVFMVIPTMMPPATPGSWSPGTVMFTSIPSTIRMSSPDRVR